MAKIGTLTLTGASGNQYSFNVYPTDTGFKSMGAVYYISKRIEKEDGTGTHTKIYIGQTGDLSERFDSHHKESCFKKHNANCVSILQESSEKTRLEIEGDLIEAYTPPCND
jgi:hypothetical protein